MLRGGIRMLLAMAALTVSAVIISGICNRFRNGWLGQSWKLIAYLIGTWSDRVPAAVFFTVQGTFWLMPVALIQLHLATISVAWCYYGLAVGLGGCSALFALARIAREA